ncbi:hypothetical protein DRJ00_01045 [Candidatus Aerophobetes bacterium]|uniref:Uncharacterized protein n=1 Tax=Aerophobetes bacterium TaxID=2030807 RepID=A0A497E5Q8_UNCAE|nr:MAG: hypothetical protein DRJ00_01045 [Candidatus Aerophobetes bacterium]
MRLEWLRVENLMGCRYEVEFDPKYTVIIGDNRQGKTLTARLIVLALYGLNQPKELDESWRLKAEELLPTSDKGLVELIFTSSEDKRYRVSREFFRAFPTNKAKVRLYEEVKGKWREISNKDRDVQYRLINELDVPPGLLSVVMSNEQSLIGAISYDKDLQANVWEGWKLRTAIIRDNIRRARDKCVREANNLRGEMESLEDTLRSIVKNWIAKKIFSPDEVSSGIDKSMLQHRLELIKNQIKNLEEEIDHYSLFFEELLRQDNLEDDSVVKKLIGIFEKEAPFLDEKEEIQLLRRRCEEYLKLLSPILAGGGKEGFQDKIRKLEDEKEKLEAARRIKRRKREPLRAECKIYPPEEGTDLIVQIPDRIAASFKYKEIATGKIAVPYDEEKEKKITAEKEKLEDLIRRFEEGRDKLKKEKDVLRGRIGRRRDKLMERLTRLREQGTVLEVDKDRYLEISRRINENRKIVKKLETAKIYFGKLYETLSEEESLKRIRKDTVSFINRIYEKTYGWDINAHLVGEEDGKERIVIKDLHGNLRSHPSGSEIHIMGLAWRWMVARGFDLPLVLDELDSLLDEKNFGKTRKLIEEEMDRQTVILTLKEGLADLPGKIYRVMREEGMSTLVSI